MMKNKIFLGLIALLVTLIVALPAVATNFADHLHILTAGGTATPALRVNQNGSGKIVEFLDGGTPVFSINNGGGIVASSILTQGATINNLILTQPTADTTATPAAVINSLAAGSVILDVQDSGTSLVKVPNGGGVNIAAPTAIATAVPALAVNNAGVSKPFEFSDGGAIVLDAYNGGGVNVVAPTAIATAVPGLSVTCTGVSECARVVAQGTPALVVEANGNVATEGGYVLQSGTAGQLFYCGETAAFTTSLAITSSTSGVATPVAANCSIAAELTGDAYNCSYTNATGTITLFVYGNEATPVANTTPVAVGYCILGTP